MNNKTNLRLIFYSVTLSFLLSCSDNTENKELVQPRPVQAIKVGNSNAISGRAFPGRATATQEVNLSFNVGGTLIELPVKIGDEVKQEALIAKLDPKEFEVKLKSAHAELMRDEKNFHRAEQLIRKGNISQVDYDLLETKFSISQANLALAEKALKDTIIKAPFNGKIASVAAKNYQTVASKQVIARLLDTSEIEMVIQIPENFISAISKVNAIMVQFDAFPKVRIPAQIKEISNEASPDTRTYPVTLTMNQPKSIEILPGMAGKATGTVAKKSDLSSILTIPASSLFTRNSNSKSYVWVIDTKTYKVRQQEVKIGELTPTGVSILKGLSSGEWVVTAGIHSIDEGEKVTILNQKGN